MSGGAFHVIRDRLQERACCRAGETCRQSVAAALSSAADVRAARGGFGVSPRGGGGSGGRLAHEVYIAKDAFELEPRDLSDIPIALVPGPDVDAVAPGSHGATQGTRAGGTCGIMAAGPFQGILLLREEPAKEVEPFPAHHGLL